MKTIFEAITTYFEADEWPIHQIDDQPAYSMTFQGENGRWTCIAQALEEERQFIFYSVCPVKAPADKRLKVAEYLTRANYGLIIGNFELNLEDGDIRYKTSIDITGHNLGAMLVAQLVYKNVLTMDRHLPQILAVINSNLSPAEAIAQLENE